MTHNKCQKKRHEAREPRFGRPSSRDGQNEARKLRFGCPSYRDGQKETPEPRFGHPCYREYTYLIHFEKAKHKITGYIGSWNHFFFSGNKPLINKFRLFTAKWIILFYTVVFCHSEINVKTIGTAKIDTCHKQFLSGIWPWEQKEKEEWTAVNSNIEVTRRKISQTRKHADRKAKNSKSRLLSYEMLKKIEFVSCEFNICRRRNARNRKV